MAIQLYLITRLRKIPFSLFPTFARSGCFASWAKHVAVYFKPSVASHGKWKKIAHMRANRGLVWGLQVD